MARRKAVRKSHIRCDCANVVRANNAPARVALNPARKYAGIILDKYTRLGEEAAASEVTWVKAHRADGDHLDADTRRDVRANAAADALAGEGIDMHPQPSQKQRDTLEFYLRRAPLVAKAAGVALAMFPPSEGQRLHRKARPEEESKAEADDGHRWAFCQNVWRCERCGTWARGDTLTQKHRRSKCKGHIAMLCAEEWTNLGHNIALVEGEVPFAFCARCGAWGNRRAHHLSRPCREPTQAGSLALKRIARGWHPWQKKLSGGGSAPRAAVRVKAAFTMASGRWHAVG